MTGEFIRVDGRKPNEIRAINMTPFYLEYAEGSVLIECGKTRILCAATVENKIPPHLKDTGQGWVTAEYALLPRSTQQRSMRDGVRGHINGRSYEIQRLIGRALRTVVDRQKLGERTIILDCDVIQADGGTRTTAITGAFVAMALACDQLLKDGKIGKIPIKDYIGAVSVGIVEGNPVVDLCYIEDAQADVDMNIVMTGSGDFVEIQGTGENTPFSYKSMIDMIDLARQGINQMIELQKKIVDIPLLK